VAESIAVSSGCVEVDDSPDLGLAKARHQAVVRVYPVLVDFGHGGNPAAMGLLIGVRPSAAQLAA
jgi:hypothetical protein